MHYFGGMTAEEVAAAVNLSVHVIRHDIRLAGRGCGVSSRSDLVVVATSSSSKSGRPASVTEKHQTASPITIVSTASVGPE